MSVCIHKNAAHFCKICEEIAPLRGLAAWLPEKEESKSTLFCVHKWKKYIGLTEAYEFCEYCDLKHDDFIKQIYR